MWLECQVITGIIITRNVRPGRNIWMFVSKHMYYHYHNSNNLLFLKDKSKYSGLTVLTSWWGDNRLKKSK